MADEEDEEQLVIIAPYAPAPPPLPDPLYRPWVGPMFIIGVPAGLAIGVFLLFYVF